MRGSGLGSSLPLAATGSLFATFFFSILHYYSWSWRVRVGIHHIKAIKRKHTWKTLELWEWWRNMTNKPKEEKDKNKYIMGNYVNNFPTPWWKQEWEARQWIDQFGYLPFISNFIQLKILSHIFNKCLQVSISLKHFSLSASIDWVQQTFPTSWRGNSMGGEKEGEQKFGLWGNVASLRKKIYWQPAGILTQTSNSAVFSKAIKGVRQPK